MSYHCQECKEECKAVTVNHGQGKTEFWGSISYDNDFQLESGCCSASVVDSFGDIISASEHKQDQEDDRADYDRDCQKDREFEERFESQFGCVDCD